MRGLLQRALHSLLQKHLEIIPSTALLAKSIATKYKYDITYSKLTRLPLSQLKDAIKVPCPILPTPEEKTQIAIFKRLRHNMKVQESSACQKCTKKCPFREIPFKDMPERPQTSNKSALHDVLYFLISFSQHEESEFSSLRWTSAYKVVLALDGLMRDLPILSKEAFLFRQVWKHYENEEKKKLTSKPNKKIIEQEETKKVLAARKIVL